MKFALRRAFNAAGIAALLSACSTPQAPVNAEELPLHAGRLSPGLRLTVADFEREQVLGGDSAVVPKPADPRQAASHVSARRTAREGGGEAVALQWKDAWYAALRIESDPPLDLRPFVDAGTLEFDVRSPDLSRAGLNIAMSCGKDCSRKVNYVVPSRTLAGKGWKHLSFSMQCFMRDGADFEQVKRPFSLETSGSGEVEVANLVVKRKGKPNAACPDYRVQSVTPGPLSEIWAIDWWMPRHEKKLQEIRALRTAGKNADVVFIGDSITQGWEDAGKKVWDQSFARYNAIDLGFGGDRTENVLWRLQHGELEGITPKVIVMMIGTNNTGDRQEDARTTAAGIRRLLDEVRLRQPKAKILLLGIFPREEKPGGALRQLNDRVNGIISGYADERSVFYLNIGEALMNPDGTLSRDVMPDLLHLSDKGYAIWARRIEPTLQRLLATP
jgi:lysophospholipase L1-like esterase